MNSPTSLSMSLSMSPRWRGVWFVLMMGGLMGLWTACSPTLNWRQFNSPEGKFSALFPGKPQVSTREVFFKGMRIPMTMTAAGKGPTLFAVGVALLPPEAWATPEAMTDTVTQFRTALLNNSGTALFSLDGPVPPLAPEVKTVAHAQMAVRAQRHPSTDAKVPGVARLVAYFFVVEGRLYQLAALGDADLTDTDLENFFGAFKLAKLTTS